MAPAHPGSHYPHAVRRPARIAAVLLAALVAGPVPTAFSAVAPDAPDPYVGDGASGFHEIVPANLTTLTIPADTNRTVRVAGLRGLPSTGVDAVSLQITVNPAKSGGRLYVWPQGQARPEDSSARYPASTTTLAILTKIGDTDIRVRTTTKATVRIDITGWYDRFTFLAYDPASGLQYHSVTPARLQSGAVDAGDTVTIDVADREGIPGPDLARAVAVYITSRGADGKGYVTADNARVLTFGTARTTGFALVRLNAQGDLRLAVHGSDTKVDVDVTGYYGVADGDIITGQSSLIPAVTLFRGRIGGTSTQIVPAASRGRLPVIGAESVFVRVLVTGANGSGSLVFHGPDGGQPSTAAVAYRAGSSTSLAVASVDLQTGSLTFTKRGSEATITIQAIGWNAFVIPPPPIVPGPPPGVVGTSPSSAAAASNSEPQRVVRPLGLAAAESIGDVSPQRTVIRQDPAAAVAAWTQDDLDRARPVPLPVSSDTTFHDPALTYPAYDSYTSDYLPPSADDDRIGRIYFKDILENLNGWCTGTVVARNLVITAAHCMTDFVSEPTRLVFAPGQRGDQVHSLWGVSVVDYYSFYETNSFGPLDFAVMVIPPTAGGDYIGDYVGWHGLYAAYVNGPIYHVGYPAEGWFELNGRCVGTTCDPYYQWTPQANYYSPAEGWWEQAYGGWTNGGASGGPIFQHIAGTGWRVSSVVSHGDNTIVSCFEAGALCTGRYYGRNTWVPVFNTWVLDLYYDYAVT